MKANRRVLLISIFARCITTLAIQAGTEGSEIHNPWLPASPAGDAYLEKWPDLVIRLQDMVFQSSFRMPLANGGIGSPDNPYVCQGSPSWGTVCHSQHTEIHPECPEFPAS